MNGPILIKKIIQLASYNNKHNNFIPVEMVSMPVPLQYEHLLELYPGSLRLPPHRGHVSTTLTRISLLHPRAASSNDSRIITYKIKISSLLIINSK